VATGQAASLPGSVLILIFLLILIPVFIDYDYDYELRSGHYPLPVVCRVPLLTESGAGRGVCGAAAAIRRVARLKKQARDGAFACSADAQAMFWAVQSALTLSRALGLGSKLPRGANAALAGMGSGVINGAIL
jgi:hypothetical protein